MVMGDLYFFAESFELMRKQKRWADWDIGVRPALERWADVRADLAAGPSTRQWVKIDRVYALLGRMEQRIEAGAPLAPDDERVLGEFVGKVPAATIVLAGEGTTRRERYWLWLCAQWARARGRNDKDHEGSP
jgi:hypothetical protein